MSITSKTITGILFIVVAIFVSTQALYASGACCSVSKGRSGAAALTFIGSTATSHELVGGSTSTLTQQALMVKYGYPVFDRLTLQATIGIPAQTRLSGIANASGRSGLIYGIGVGYAIPELFEHVEIFASVGYTHSAGNLRSSVNGSQRDQLFRIREVQAIVLAERELIERVSLYAGARLYSGRNSLEDDATGLRMDGEREGNISPLAGLRFSLLENLGLVAEGSLGHTKVASLGLVMAL